MAWTTRDNWLTCFRPQPAAGCRLVCLPHAGGGAATFFPWAEPLGPDIEVLAVRLPGRESRFDDPPHRRMQPLVDELAQVLQPMLVGRRYALYGHSMGAGIAFELARRLAATPAGEPAHLFMAGFAVPDSPPERPMHLDPDPVMLSRLGELGGLPEEVLAQPELLELLGPSIRTDLELVECYQTRPGPRPTCPVTVLGGRDDHSVDDAGLAAWAKFVAGPFAVRMFDGGHFFVRSAQDPLLEMLRDTLSGQPSGAGPVRPTVGRS